MLAVLLPSLNGGSDPGSRWGFGPKPPNASPVQNPGSATGRRRVAGRHLQLVARRPPVEAYIDYMVTS